MKQDPLYRDPYTLIAIYAYKRGQKWSLHKFECYSSLEKRQPGPETPTIDEIPEIT